MYQPPQEAPEVTGSAIAQPGGVSAVDRGNVGIGGSESATSDRIDQVGVPLTTTA